MERTARTEVVRGTLGREGIQELAARTLEEPVALNSRNAFVLWGERVGVPGTEG